MVGDETYLFFERAELAAAEWLCETREANRASPGMCLEVSLDALFAGSS